MRMTSLTSSPKTTSRHLGALPVPSSTRFYKGQKASRAVVDILNLKQQKDESLTSYMTRFTTKSFRLKCTLDELLRSAFHNGLIMGPQYTKLCKCTPANIHDMWKVVHTIAMADEATKRKVK